jgi:hypothetical protein
VIHTALMAMSLAIGPSGPAREPIFIVTAERRATWNRMRRENHRLFQLAAANCAKTGARGERYGDTGLWCAWIHQATGDALAARRAIGKLVAVPVKPANANAVREFFIEYVVMADWLWSAMTPAEQAKAGAVLDGWAGYATGKTGKQYQGGFRTYDSDQTIGSYFGLATLDRFNRSTGRPGRWLDSTSAPDGGDRVPIGGLAATDSNRSTARNAVEFFSRRARGGEWHESESYNQGTVALLAMGVEAMRTALGRDAFPTTTAMLHAAATRETFAVTPDLAQGVQWGDEEHPREFKGRLFRRVTLLGMLQGITRNPATHKMLLDLWSKHGFTGYLSGEPHARILLLYDPYGPVAATMPVGGYVAPGRGHLYVKTGSELFFAEASNPSEEDHDVHYLSNLALYRNGSWVLDHPLGYGGAANGAYATNGVSYAGFGAMPWRRMVRADSGDGWWSITGETRGGAYDNYYDPPPAFLRHATRTTWYTNVDGWSVIVTRDSVRMQEPSKLPKYERYRANHRWQLDQAKGRWETIWHAPLPPAAGGDQYSWRMANGESVQIIPFGAGITSDVIDEKKLWPQRVGGTGVNLATRAHQIRVRTTGEVLWTVVLAGRGTAPSVQRTASGVRVGDREVAMMRGVPTVR